MPLRTRNQFVVKSHSSERTHALPLYVHVRECDLAHFHKQECNGVNIVQILLTLLDADSAFQALVYELDNVRMIDELIKTKAGALFHISAMADVVQVQWQLQDHPHSLVNILQHSQRQREENFVPKQASSASKHAKEAAEEYVGGMLRPLPTRKVAVTVWIYPPHVKIPPTGDRVPENPLCGKLPTHLLFAQLALQIRYSIATLSQSLSVSFASSFSSSGAACRCGQAWNDSSVKHFCQLIDPTIDVPLAPKPPPQRSIQAIQKTTLVRALSSRSSEQVTKMTTPSTPPVATDRSHSVTPSSAAPTTLINGASRRGAVSENIQVFIRIRPLIDRETVLSTTSEGPATATGSHSIRTLDDRTIEVRSNETTIKCSYDAVFDPSFSQDQVYDRVRECTQSFLAGFNSTLFAYGQTGSGKSFTMFGSEGDVSRYRPGHYKSQAGIIPRAIKEIFEGIVQLGGEAQGVVLYCSFVQIYNEQIFDLLRDGSMASPLEIREDRTNGIYVDGLSEYAVRTVNDCLALLQCGEQHRAVRSTHMNQVSSRSHSVFQLLLEQRRKDGTSVKSKFNLVDLAGSEKWNFGSDMQQFHISEMTNINLSLHTLGRCIAALSSKAPGAQHVPYRDSKLTRLLQDSLGGNTKTKIIATLSPSLDCIDESISTLKFADRAKQVMVTVRVNEHREIDPAYVERLEDEIQRLKEVVKLLQSGDAALDPEVQDDEEGRDVNRGAGAGAGGGGGEDTNLRAMLARVMQENMVLRDKQERQQKEMEMLRVRLMGGGSASGSLAGGGGAPPSAEAEAQLAQAKQQLEATLRQLKDASDKFFKFEIEEEELRSIHERVFKSQQITGSGGAGGSLSSSIAKPRPPSLTKPSGSLPSPGGPQKPLAAVDIQYRVRGRSSSQSARTGTATSNNNNNNNIIAELRSDPAAKQALDLEKELEQSRKAIEKQQKLQNWLIEKEKRELLKLQQEHEHMEDQRRQLAERDAKFFKHAQAAKKKLLTAKAAEGDANGRTESKHGI